jgi:hypothetical protein
VFKALFDAFERLILASLVGIFEWYTGYFRLSKLQKATSLLAQLKSLKEDGKLQRDEALNLVYGEIEAELAAVMEQTRAAGRVPVWVKKGLAGSAPWLLLLLVFFPGLSRGDKDSASASLLTLIFACVFGLTGTLLPDCLGPYGLYLVYPAVTFALVVFALTLWHRGKRAAG